MASLKHILNDESTSAADEERYGCNSTVQRSNIEGYILINSQSYASSEFNPVHSGMWDTVLSGSTLQHDNNVTSEDASLNDFGIFEDMFDLPHESTMLDNVQIQYGQYSGPELFDDSIPVVRHDSMPLDFSEFDPEPSSLQTLSSTDTTVNTSNLPNSTEICYGMVSRAAVRLAGDMLQLDHKLQRTEGSYGFGFAGFNILLEKGEINLRFHDGYHLGSTNMQFCDGVLGILKFHIRMEAIANLANVRSRIAKAEKASDAIVRIDINVFGPRDNATVVGKILSDSKIWLQKPDILQKGMDYENPQFLELEGFEELEVDRQPLEMASGQKRLGMDDQRFEEAVEDVFNRLTRCDQLERVEKDQRVKTKLLDHQEESLFFMMQRETGDIPEQYCLWKREEQQDGTVQYRHAVTGATSHIQYLEAGGGVLADDMGMGKSLSILSLIAKTSYQAEEWLYGNKEEPNSILDSWKTRSKATLVIVSSALLINEWIHEINKHLDGSIHFVRYHGMNRKSLRHQLQTADIIFTTYTTLVREFQQKQRRKHDSSLHEIEFFRVVLDEAHIIRRKRTLFNRAVSELSAKSRWCLTGTPIQNKFEDIGALFAFIRARPFHNISMFRRFIVNPFDQSEEQRAVAVKRLVTLIDSLCIRRTKARLKLPDAQVFRNELDFSDVERMQYDKTVSDMSRRLREEVGNSKSMHDFGLFQINLQLRILCNHGTHQALFAWRRNDQSEMREFALTSMVATGEVVCSYCKQVMPVTSARNIYRMYGEQCKHAICDLCSGTTLNEEGEDEKLEIQCPICAETELLREGTTQSGARKARDEHYFQPNGIVFSCWTRTLELISRYLKAAGIIFERIDGGISLREREQILEAFADRADLPVLIMTTGTGAYGLNLTAANRIFIVEPQWNPAVENQAISRAIRLGQVESVQVTRYIIKNTVEQVSQWLETIRAEVANRSRKCAHSKEKRS
ncbi:hypothetical protein BP6252_13923 [Coleophoma cylindrospora]|uniref:Uncharacterized protein n=1 Tax=Coleophoma cylindrospora TaxID=1849047 RepID=A0A3D8Q586_9HELO|nr:hypothetical protein BP6252_13923 [Coleophoma cylindrospora]